MKYLLGDSKRGKLDWKPEVDFKGLVKMMVEHDLVEAEKEKELLKKGLISPTCNQKRLINNA